MAHLIILLAVMGAEYVHAAYKLSGPYELNVVEINQCRNMTDNKIEYTTKLTKKSKTEKVWSSTFTLPLDLDEKSKMVLDADLWGSTGGWNKNAFHHEAEGLCRALLEDFTGVHEVLINCFGVNEGCPIKKGTFEVKDFPTKWGAQEKFPELPYGRFRLEIKLFSGDEYAGCFSLTVDVNEGPYEVNVLEINQCQNMTDNKIKYTTKLTKKSKSEKVWSSTYTLPLDLNEESKMVLDVDLWGTTGGWNKNAFHHEAENLCKMLEEDFVSLQEKLAEAFGVNEICPLKSGTYEIKDFPTKWEAQKKFPQLPYGKFRGEIKLFSGDEYGGCFALTAEGPYEVTLHEVNQCENMTGNKIEYTTKFSKKSKSEKVWSSTLVLPMDLDEKSKMIADLDVWGTTGGWIKNAFHHETENLCKVLEEDLPEVHEKLKECMGLNEGCPKKGGTFEMKDYPTKWGPQKKFPELPYGKFKTEMKLFSGDEYVGCIGAILDITEIPGR